MNRLKKKEIDKFSITREELKNIVRQELESYFNEENFGLLAEPSKEVNELGYCHSPKDGTFTDCDKGSVYSLTTKAANKHNIDKSYVKRGTVSSKKTREAPKVSTKYGVNTSKTKSAGRKLLDGDDISPKYSVSKYPEKYGEGLDLNNKKQRQAEIERCRELGFKTAKEVIVGFLRKQNALALAGKGELYGKGKKG